MRRTGAPDTRPVTPVQGFLHLGNKNGLDQLARQGVPLALEPRLRFNPRAEQGLQKRTAFATAALTVPERFRLLRAVAWTL